MWLQWFKHFGKNVHGCGDMKSISNGCAFRASMVDVLDGDWCEQTTLIYILITLHMQWINSKPCGWTDERTDWFCLCCYNTWYVLQVMCIVQFHFQFWPNMVHVSNEMTSTWLSCFDARILMVETATTTDKHA